MKLPQLDKAKLPRHIAFIVDGNRRWAEIHNLPRYEGHRKGSQVVLRIIEDCLELNISTLTFYLFSTENWQRSEKEVSFLMQLGVAILRGKLNSLHQKGIQIRGIGRIDELEAELKNLIREAEKLTKSNKKMILNLAINYGGRAEIVDAVNKIIQGKKKKISEDTFPQYLYTSNLPDPDLLIRTGGDCRVSNFLLWQVAYTEIYVSPKYWPDLSKARLYQALKEYQERKRRWGR